MNHISSTIALFTLLGTATAQLSGTYSVGGASANYPTLTAAAAALAAQGVNGPVVMNINIGTYTESWTIQPIKGTSATNTVTFRSVVKTINTLKAKLRATSGDCITIQGGVSHLILDGLSFEATSNAAAIRTLRNSTSRQVVTNLTVRDCVFTKGVRPNSRFGAIHTQSINTWNLLNNEFDLTGTALYSQGSINMEIAYNRFTSNSPYCLSIWNSNRSRSRIHNNVFLGTNTTSTIRISLSHYGTDIFHNTFNVNLTRAVPAVDNSSCCSVWNRYFNNIFRIRGLGYAIRHRVSRDIELNNNLYWTASKVIGNYSNQNYNTLSAWGTALGAQAKNGNRDNNSIVGDPKFKTATGFEITNTSPAVGKALPKPASWTAGHEVKDDINGFLRGTKKDIGAWELSGCKLYGKGCPGTGNKTPALSCSGNIAPGDTVSLDLTNGRPASLVYTAIGAPPASVPLGGGCTLLTNVLVLFQGRTDGSGTFAFRAPIPRTLAILGLSAYAQMGVADPAAAGIGAALTNGLQLRL